MTARKIVPVNEALLQDMIAGESGYSRPTRSTGHTPSNVNTEHSEPQQQETPVELEQKTQKQLERSEKSPKHSDKQNNRTTLEEYRRTFLQVPWITDRKPVFLSASVREQLDRIVRQLGDRKMSVSGLIENLARNHIETYGEEIEKWRKL